MQIYSARVKHHGGHVITLLDFTYLISNLKSLSAGEAQRILSFKYLILIASDLSSSAHSSRPTLARQWIESVTCIKPIDI